MFQVAAVDSAQHKEEVTSSVPVSKDQMMVYILPESSRLVPGVPNTLYVLTSYPDGTPAAAAVNVYVQQKHFDMATDEMGFAEFSYTPSAQDMLQISVKDSRGRRGHIALRPEMGAIDSPLLRTDRAIYRAGETMSIEALSSAQSGTLYIDVIKGKQLLLTKTLNLTGGKSYLKIATTPDMVGAIEIRAYRVGSQGVVQDNRRVFVTEAKDLKVSLKADRTAYRPGHEGTLDFTVKDGDDRPAVAALGVNIVDESVFALSDARTGLEKVQFLLEEEFSKPRLEVCAHSINVFKRQVALPGVPQDSRLTKLALNSMKGAGDYSMVLESYSRKSSAITERKEKYFAWLVSGGIRLIILLLFFIPVGVFMLTLKNGIHKRHDVERFISPQNHPKAFMGLLVMVFGYLLLYIVPFLFVGLRFVLEEIMHHHSYDRQMIAMMALLIIAIEVVIIVCYLVYMARTLKDDTVRSIPTLRHTIQLLMTYIISLVLFIAIAIMMERGHSISMSDIAPEEVMVPLLINLFLMPLFLFIALGSYLFRPRKQPVSLSFIGIAMFTLFLLFLYITIIGSVAKNLRRGWGTPVTMGMTRAASGPLSSSRFEPSNEMRRVRPDEGGMTPLSARDSSMLMQESMEKKDAGNLAAGTIAEPNTAAPVYLRQFFPETMYFNPQLITDERGKASVKLRMADSITTWRIATFASSKKGEMGSSEDALRVFQDFFIDPDLPTHLTQGDEISLPVAIYNYLDKPQKIRLMLKGVTGLALLDGDQKELLVAPGSVDVAHFRMKAKDVGIHDLTFYAYGSSLNDAVKKSIEIVPDGKEIVASESGWLKGDIFYSFNVPGEALPASEKIVVKIYPGIFSQVVEGLDRILTMPHGCFEQTSSTAYPNIMAINYMKATGKITPEIEMKAEAYLNADYQRLLTFEVPGGGFSLYGKQPASVWLSAYGLMEFNDMKAVRQVDEALIDRTRSWLRARCSPDGSYEGNLRTTAYVALALLESGEKSASMYGTLHYLKANMRESRDTYELALCANVLALAEPGGKDCTDILERLASLKQQQNIQQQDELVFWPVSTQTLCGGYGISATIEVTALAAKAMMTAQAYPELTKGALAYLVKNKDQTGTWHSTQSTVLALKALMASLGKTSGNSRGTVLISINNQGNREIAITPSQADVMHIIDLKKYAKKGENRIAIKTSGQLASLYQIVASYHVPWKGEGAPRPLSISLDYDRKELKSSDRVKVTAHISNNLGQAAPMIMVDLGIPPGFMVDQGDFEKLISRQVIERFEQSGNTVILYFGTLQPGAKLSIPYTLTAKYPIKARSPISRIYEYYNPQVFGVSEPQQVVVK
jgi:hypothetical protein